jgi:hypothetical protein
MSLKDKSYSLIDKSDQIVEKLSITHSNLCYLSELLSGKSYKNINVGDTKELPLTATLLIMTMLSDAITTISSDLVQGVESKGGNRD